MTIAVGTLSLDPVTGRAEFRGVTAQLTRKEAALLSFLIGGSPKPYRSVELLRKVWGYLDYTGNTAVVRTHICKIRKKLGAECIRYKKGWGYSVPAGGP